MTFAFYGFLLISLGWLCRGLFSLFRWFQARRYTGCAQGKVIRYLPNFRWSGNFVATVEYFVEDIRYQQSWVPMPYQENLQQGNRVAVLYDHQNPSRFVLADYNGLRRRGMIELLFAVCYLLLALGYQFL